MPRPCKRAKRRSRAVSPQAQTPRALSLFTTHRPQTSSPLVHNHNTRFSHLIPTHICPRGGARDVYVVTKAGVLKSRETTPRASSHPTTRGAQTSQDLTHHHNKCFFLSNITQRCPRVRPGETNKHAPLPKPQRHQKRFWESHRCGAPASGKLPNTQKSNRRGGP